MTLNDNQENLENKKKTEKKIEMFIIISYQQIQQKEKIWKKWIEKNKELFNVYFHYKDFSLIQSEWIRKHTIPSTFLASTTYYHIVPAYINLLKYAILHDSKNQWFCFLTESCVPIISPSKFKALFFEYSKKSIIKIDKASWNIQYHKRANLRFLSPPFHLQNEPWFLLTKEHAMDCIKYSVINSNIYHLICQGGLANESIFAIMLLASNKLHRHNSLVNETTYITDWIHKSSSTSPHIFQYGNKSEIDYITYFLQKNKYAMFLRKVHSQFPDILLENILF